MQDHTFKKVIVSDTATPGSNYAPERIALFDEAGAESFDSVAGVT
jgi:hypothetical protein